MTWRMLTSALLAGAVAGLLAALLHFSLVQNLILQAEGFEAGTALSTEAHHDHGGDHDHSHAHPADSAQRNTLTVMFTVLIYCGYALLLVAGFALAESLGHRVTLREGLLWGLAGFAAFQLMPALGVAPELPGTASGELQVQQIWWGGTAICTAAGLALLAYGRGVALWALAVALIALPHVIGAPQADHMTGLAPPELASAFAARALGVGLIAWAVLGLVAGRLWHGRST
jgi:cobalt transporter subunit CbtA